jgi:hypothetical protein
MNSTDVESVARYLAAEHRKEDTSIEAVYWLRHDTEVRLIEVTKSVPADGSVMPFRFTPDPPDVPSPSLVILIHPSDWARRKELEWPADLDPETHPLSEIQDANGQSH